MLDITNEDIEGLDDHQLRESVGAFVRGRAPARG